MQRFSVLRGDRGDMWGEAFEPERDGTPGQEVVCDIIGKFKDLATAAADGLRVCGRVDARPPKTVTTARL